MAKISPVPPATVEFTKSFQTTEFAKLQAQFKALLIDINREVVDAGKEKGRVTLLGSEFQVKAQASSRDTARSLSKPIVTGDVEGPTQLVLTNLKKGPDLQEIKITIPKKGISQGKVSLISVVNKSNQVVSFTPSSNTFIKRDSMQSGRTRITADEIRKE